MLHPTGVDRVERAYLRALLADSKSQLFGISRTALGFVLLDRRGCLAVATALDSGAWGDADLLSKFNPRLDQARRIGQSFVRRIAFKKARKSRLLAMLETHLPRNYTYINVGHSNLNPRMFDGVDAAQKVVLIHDTIPLDLPNTQRLGARDEFYQKLKLVSERADRVICTSSQCEADVRRHLDKIGRVPPITTALLGIDVPVLDTKSHPPESPCFLIFCKIGVLRLRRFIFAASGAGTMRPFLRDWTRVFQTLSSKTICRMRKLRRYFQVPRPCCFRRILKGLGCRLRRP